MHKMLLGIEHLMTGVQLRERESTIPGYPGTFTFQQESPSLVRVISDGPFQAYWLSRHSFLESVECTKDEEKVYGSLRYSNGEVEWWANIAGETLRQIYHLPTANISGEKQPTDAVLRAMRRKHGALADSYISKLRWDGLNKCWFYTHYGMLLEVEEDGYIHS